MEISRKLSNVQICDAIIQLVTDRCTHCSIEIVAVQLNILPADLMARGPTLDEMIANAFIQFVERTFRDRVLEVTADEPSSKILRRHADWLYDKLETLESFYALLATHKISILTVNQHFERSPTMLITSMLLHLFEGFEARAPMPKKKATEKADALFAAVGHHVRQVRKASDFKVHAPRTAYLDEVCRRLLTDESIAKRESIPIEIERKYLLTAMPDLSGLDVECVWTIEQGYIPGDSITERVRRAAIGDRLKCTRTVKLGSGISRIEFEDEIDPQLFEQLWVATQGQRVTKERFVVSTRQGKWELDRFTDRQLVLLEIELSSEHESVHMPDAFKAVLVREVTEDKKFTNWALSRNNVALSAKS
jgi:CYTH domain-containing protein